MPVICVATRGILWLFIHCKYKKTHTIHHQRRVYMHMRVRDPYDMACGLINTARSLSQNTYPREPTQILHSDSNKSRRAQGTLVCRTMDMVAAAEERSLYISPNDAGLVLTSKRRSTKQKYGDNTTDIWRANNIPRETRQQLEDTLHVIFSLQTTVSRSMTYR